MNILKIAGLTILLWLKQVWLFPKNIVNAVKQRRRTQVERNEGEIERLDRLRFPSKYRGR